MTKEQRRATLTKEHLLDAALDVIHLDGIGGFTLERVAEEAGVSKGGLLYHFPNKDALMEKLLRRTFRSFERLFNRYLADQAPGKGRRLRAYIQASFDESLTSLDLAALLRAATAEDPNLIDLVDKEMRRWYIRLVSDGVPTLWMNIVRRATDAYWVDHLLGITPDDPAEREAYRDALLELTYNHFIQKPPDLKETA